MMTERKMDLERRIDLLQGEREGLSSTLDESADRIIMLEKQAKEQESMVSEFSVISKISCLTFVNISFTIFQLRGNEKTMEELRSANESLQERLDNMYRSMSMSPGQGQNLSLMNEMENSDSERSLSNARRPFSQIDEDDIECDHPDDVNLSTLESKEVRVN